MGSSSFPGASGGGASVAGDLPYTPATPEVWGVEPEDVGDALDNVAAEVQALQEGAAPPVVLDLVNSVPKDLFTIALAAGEMKSGLVEFAIFCKDGANRQALTGRLAWSGVNKAGVLSAESQLSVDVPAFGRSSASTLDVQTDVGLGVGEFTVRVTVTSSLTPTAFKINFKRQDLGSLS